MSNAEPPLNRRVACPCCGYPTLSEAAAYDICELCNWEDDGQGDQDADVVKGGPNGTYSLTEARDNFRRYLIMYRPDHDTRITGSETPTELEAKRQLMVTFDQLRREADGAEQGKLVATVRGLERVLEAELHRSLRAYEDRHRTGGAAQPPNAADKRGRRQVPPAADARGGNN
jgi:cysteine-rich CPCC protein